MNKKYFLIVLMILVRLGFVFSLWANDGSENQEIATIQKAIATAGLSWEAGKTSMTRLSHEERLMRLGARKIFLLQKKQRNRMDPALDLPPTLDWRNNSGNWVTSIKSQGNCGSCWAFATAGVLESVVKIAKNNKTNLDLSEQTLVSCSGAGDCGGGYTTKAADFVKSTGIPRESCFPYTATNAACNPCDDWQSKTARITSWDWYGDEPAEDLETALQDGPISTFMIVYSDFYSYTSGIYERTPGSNEEGGHAVVIIGYNDPQKYWICKNSWDTDWGEDGFFRIRMGNSEIGTQCVSMSKPIFEDNKPPVLKAIPDQSVEEGKSLAFNLSATDEDNDPLTFSCKSLPTDATLDAQTGAFSWMPSYTQSGVYDVEFGVTDGMAKVSKMAKITVINVKYKKW
jgi:C1A family cysteine protease